MQRVIPFVMLKKVLSSCHSITSCIHHVHICSLLKKRARQGYIQSRLCSSGEVIENKVINFEVQQCCALFIFQAACGLRLHVRFVESPMAASYICRFCYFANPLN